MRWFRRSSRTDRHEGERSFPKIRHLVLRRYWFGDQIEGIAFQRVAEDDDEGLSCAWMDSTPECFIYAVSLPATWSVRPADLRRFISDHETVRSFITTCVTDNVTNLVFEPHSSAVLNQASQNVEAALRDLSSVFDVTQVACHNVMGNAIEVCVTGEFKNGQQTTIKVVSEDSL